MLQGCNAGGFVAVDGANHIALLNARIFSCGAGGDACNIHAGRPHNVLLEILFQSLKLLIFLCLHLAGGNLGPEFNDPGARYEQPFLSLLFSSGSGMI